MINVLYKVISRVFLIKKAIVCSMFLLIEFKEKNRK